MKIYDTNLTGTSAAEAGRAQESQKTERGGHGHASQPGTAGSADRVEFSGALARLSHTFAASNQGRAARVSALAAQYQSGKYRPDATATSRAVIAEALN